MNTPTDFLASLLDLRRQIDRCLVVLDDPTQWRPLDPGLPADGFCLGNWRIVPRDAQNTPSESPEASGPQFDAWIDSLPNQERITGAHARFAWQAWQSSRAQLNSPSHQ